MATAEASATLRTANPIPTVTRSSVREPQEPAERQAGQEGQPHERRSHDRRLLPLRR